MDQVTCVIIHDPVENTYTKYSATDYVISANTGDNLDETIISKRDKTETIIVRQTHVTHTYYSNLKQ